MKVSVPVPKSRQHDYPDGVIIEIDPTKRYIMLIDTVRVSIDEVEAIVDGLRYLKVHDMVIVRLVDPSGVSLYTLEDDVCPERHSATSD